MALERTFSIIKPDATARNLTGAINAMIEAAGLRIVAQKRLRISLPQARQFYAVHKERPFFGELVDFMVSGPVVVQVLRGRQRHREVPRADGRHRPGQGGARHHPQGARAIDRKKFGARFRRPRHGGTRNRAVLFRERDHRLARSRASGDRVHSLAQMLDFGTPGHRYCRAGGAIWIGPRSGSRSARSSGSIFCCPATTPW